MAVFCLAVLLVVLGTAALLSLPQLGEDSVIPEVGVAPNPRVGLDDAEVVLPAQRSAVAPAYLVGVEGPQLAASEPAGAAGGSAASVDIAAAQPVAVAPSTTSPPANLPHQPPAAEPLAPPQPPAAPVVIPVSTPAPVDEPTRPLPGSGVTPTPPNPAGGPGQGGGIVSGPVQIYEGDEYAYSFLFYVQPDAYRTPGEDNLILRFADELDQSYSFGLQLWDDGSGTQRGLWASGDAMDGERFLAPVPEAGWHEIVVYFQASSEDDGLYLLMLDGKPIDTRAWVSLIETAGGYGLLEAGLFREGERIEGTSGVLFGPARLGDSLEAVLP